MVRFVYNNVVVDAVGRSLTEGSSKQKEIDVNIRSFIMLLMSGSLDTLGYPLTYLMSNTQHDAKKILGI